MSKISPFFTISIPSLNRIESLKLVINSILTQTFSDYEILIVDDHSDENIKDYIHSLSNSRIRFIENNKRKGFKYTYIECLLKAKGKYVLTLGNDDMLCGNNTLAHVHKKLMNKNNIGLAKLSLVYYYQKLNMPCFSPQQEKKDVYIKKTDYIHFFQAIDDYSLTHIAGNIYLRELIDKSNVLDNDLIPFFRILVNCAVKKGFLLIADEYVAVAMSTSFLPLFFEKEINKESWFYVNHRIYSQYVSENEARRLVAQKMKERFPFFVSHKSYMGSKALVFLVKEYIAFDRSFQYNFKMWVSFFVGLAFPRYLFFRLRDMRYRSFVNKFNAPTKYYEVLNLIK